MIQSVQDLATRLLSVKGRQEAVQKLNKILKILLDEPNAVMKNMYISYLLHLIVGYFRKHKIVQIKDM
ncbi:hypothetical protein [Desulfitobacterium sp.]|uniref:hypothetical protein n=1 Tax=Desulfitobacterium sp. TaxID=49981 RepID=UPI002CC453C3|nr:hypothetical protein [Desulfitobacterium sp.]HVJ50760.1 hypothetical protein [Desulfitobacterium sp.]